jgi:serine/threonine protein kinase
MRPDKPGQYVVDEYGNRHARHDELARAGQGVVYRTADSDLAIKLPLKPGTDQLDDSKDFAALFRRIRSLPIPSRIPMSLPLAILRDQPGYVMRLLGSMEPFDALDFQDLESYSASGSTKRRLYVLYQCAAMLARLHAVGIVYVDLSTDNVLLGPGETPEVWLIDTDNLRVEADNGPTVFTPHFGAPEVVQRTDSARPRTDAWAFAVLAFKLLTMGHPFLGRRVLGAQDEHAGWDADPVEDGVPSDLDEQAYAGLLPWILDEEDDSNAATTGLPTALVTTPRLLALFQETFGPGRTSPHRRPATSLWAWELARAFDNSLTCVDCRMSFIADQHDVCPYCKVSAPRYVVARGPFGEKVYQSGAESIAVPARLLVPFSPNSGDDVRYQVEADFEAGTVRPVRGTTDLPPELSFEFRGGAR